MDRLISSGEAAQTLGVSRQTLNAWVQTGLITPHSRTAGGHMRWSLTELQEQVRAVNKRQLSAKNEGAPMPAEPASTPERQPVVAAIVTSPLGVLAGRRNDGRPPWTFIAGEIEPGESQADAAVREVKEETGLVVIAGEREIGRRVHPKTGRTMIYLACAPSNGTDVFVGDEEELAEVRWLSLPEADDLLPGMFEPVHAHLVATLGNR